MNVTIFKMRIVFKPDNTDIFMSHRVDSFRIVKLCYLKLNFINATWCKKFKKVPIKYFLRQIYTTEAEISYVIMDFQWIPCYVLLFTLLNFLSFLTDCMVVGVYMWIAFTIIKRINYVNKQVKKISSVNEFKHIVDDFFPICTVIHIKN